MSAGRRGRPGVAGICGAPPGSGVAASCVGAPAAFVVAETCGLEGRGPRPRWRAVGVGAGILRNPAEGGARDRGHPARTFARCAMSPGRRGRPGGAGLRGAPGTVASCAGAAAPTARIVRRRSWWRRRAAWKAAVPGRRWRAVGAAAPAFCATRNPAEGGARDRGLPDRTSPLRAMPAGRRGGGRCGNLAGLRRAPARRRVASAPSRRRRGLPGLSNSGYSVRRASRPHVSTATKAAGRGAIPRTRPPQPPPPRPPRTAETAAMLSACTENTCPAEGGARDRGHPARTFPQGAMSAGKARPTAPGPGDPRNAPQPPPGTAARDRPATAEAPPAPNGRNGSHAERLHRNACPAEGGARDRGHPARTFPQGATLAGKARTSRLRGRPPPPAPGPAEPPHPPPGTAARERPATAEAPPTPTGETAAIPSACTEMLTPPKAGPGTAGILPARLHKARRWQGRRERPGCEGPTARPGPGGAPQCPTPAPRNSRARTSRDRRRTFPRGATSARKRKRTRCPPVPTVPITAEFRYRLSARRSCAAGETCAVPGSAAARWRAANTAPSAGFSASNGHTQLGGWRLSCHTPQWPFRAPGGGVAGSAAESRRRNREEYPVPAEFPTTSHTRTPGTAHRPRRRRRLPGRRENHRRSRQRFACADAEPAPCRPHS